MFFRKKKPPVKKFDREHLRPVVRSSICTGEQTAGFRDVRSGHFTEVCLIRDPRDLDEFLREYGIDAVTYEY